MVVNICFLETFAGKENFVMKDSMDTLVILYLSLNSKQVWKIAVYELILSRKIKHEASDINFQRLSDFISNKSDLNAILAFHDGYLGKQIKTFVFWKHLKESLC